MLWLWRGRDVRHRSDNGVHGNARLCLMARKIDTLAQTPFFSQRRRCDRCYPLGSFLPGPDPWAPKNGSCGRRNRDLLVFLGDIFEGHGVMPNAIPALNHMSIPLGKWFVDGNHESHQSSEASLKVLEQAGFQRLENQWAEPAPGLILSGVNDLTNHRRRNIDGDPLAPALANRPEGATILLSHTPWQTERAAQAGVELMLSGHTHGGQIWPFGYLVQRVYPFIAGRYNINGMTLLVSRGTGTWGPRMRLWHRSEIIKIILRAPQRISVGYQ